MGWFENLKKNKDTEEEPVWRFVYGEIDNKEALMRVNVTFTKAKYAHTYYIRLRYGDDSTTTLPSGIAGMKFLDEVYNTEDKVSEILEDTFRDSVVYLGCATFGGSAYLTYASNYDINWVGMISHYMKKKIEGGQYFGDNMGYYNKIMYPKEFRGEN